MKGGNYIDNRIINLYDREKSYLRHQIKIHEIRSGITQKDKKVVNTNKIHNQFQKNRSLSVNEQRLNEQRQMQENNNKVLEKIIHINKRQSQHNRVQQPKIMPGQSQMSFQNNQANCWRKKQVSKQRELEQENTRFTDNLQKVKSEYSQQKIMKQADEYRKHKQITQKIPRLYGQIQYLEKRVFNKGRYPSQPNNKSFLNYSRQNSTYMGNDQQESQTYRQQEQVVTQEDQRPSKSKLQKLEMSQRDKQTSRNQLNNSSHFPMAQNKSELNPEEQQQLNDLTEKDIPRSRRDTMQTQANVKESQVSRGNTRIIESTIRKPTKASKKFQFIQDSDDDSDMEKSMSQNQELSSVLKSQRISMMSPLVKSKLNQQSRVLKEKQQEQH